MFKRIISLFLVFVLLFTLGACKSEDSEQETESGEYIQSDVGDNEISSDDVENASSTAPNTDNTLQATNNDNTTATTTTEAVRSVKVTVPEGYTLVRIAWLLEDKGVCDSDDFIKAAQTYTEWLDLSQYSFLNDMKKASNVCFYLEGYFFPLTYDLQKDMDPKQVIKTLLNGTKGRFNDSLLQRVRQSGYNLHEILTIASIIEKEAFKSSDRTMISSVLHNRLNAGMKLQCDPTITYCTGVIDVIYPDKLDYYKYYYNTYRCSALPAGPICNPGMGAIEAALSPAQSDYFYFILEDKEPYNSYFSKTYEEHSQKWEEIQNG
ncbi:MAG: endolytic transglycosylase MltG [Oscillospiraceae bacterium]|nr:endolytic transglycosylase MltG [Oscillospiraceae bacterium]